MNNEELVSALLEGAIDIQVLDEDASARHNKQLLDNLAKDYAEAKARGDKKAMQAIEGKTEALKQQLYDTNQGSYSINRKYENQLDDIDLDISRNSGVLKKMELNHARTNLKYARPGDVEDAKAELANARSEYIATMKKRRELEAEREKVAKKKASLENTAAKQDKISANITSAAYNDPTRLKKLLGSAGSYRVAAGGEYMPSAAKAIKTRLDTLPEDIRNKLKTNGKYDDGKIAEFLDNI